MKFSILSGLNLSVLAKFSLFFLLSTFAFASQAVLKNDEILSQKVSQKINEISSELFSKTGIFTAVIALKNMNNKSAEQIYKELNLAPLNAVLFLSQDEKVVKIFANKEVLALFDREQILSPFPERGTIIPILTAKNGKDIFNAALLNGFADMAEQIATNKGVTLQSAIGSANKTTLNLLRFFIYGLILFAVMFLIFKRVKNG